MEKYLLFALFSILIVSIQAFDCSSITSQTKCQTFGCTWTTSCGGSYTYSCPSCYHVDPIDGSNLGDGSLGAPFLTLDPAFQALSGTGGNIVVINAVSNVATKLLGYALITSNIALKSLFADDKFVLSLEDFDVSSSPLNPKAAIAITGSTAKLDITDCLMNEKTGVSGINRIFYASTAGKLTFTNVNLMDHLSSTILFYIESTSTNSQFVYTGGLYKNSAFTFQLLIGTHTVTGVDFIDILTNDTLFAAGTNFALTNIYVSNGNALFAQLVENSLFTVNSITIDSFTGNFLYAQNSARVLIQSSAFKNIFQSRSEPFIHIKGKGTSYNINSPGPHTLNYITFENIQVRASVLLVETGAITINLLGVSMHNIKKIVTSSEKAIEDLYYETQWPGGVCMLGRDTISLKVTDSNFTNIYSHCIALKQSALVLINLIFDNSEIEDSYQSVINSSTSIDSLSRNDGVTFVNFEDGTRDVQPLHKVTVTDVRFINNKIYSKFGGAFRFTGIFTIEITIQNSIFTGNGAHNGGAIYIENPLAALATKNCIFRDNIALYGGAIYKTSTAYKTNLIAILILISQEDDILEFNKAIYKGGAIYAHFQTISLTSCNFTENSAQNGGAIYFTKNNYLSTYVNRLSNNRFIRNTASNSGGAIKVLFDYFDLSGENNFTLIPNTFDQNADAQGLQISEGKPDFYKFSFYNILVELTQTNIDYFEMISNSSLTELVQTFTTKSIPSEVILNHKSGHELNQIILVEIYDDRNQLAEYIHNEAVSSTISAVDKTSSFQSYLLASPVTLTFNKGKFIMKSNIMMVGEPKTTATLSLAGDIDPSFILPDAETILEFDFEVYFSDCEVGDVYDPITKICSTCPEGTYSYANPYVNAACLQCNHKVSTCLGGAKVAPKQGYWRYNIFSDNFLQCKQQYACKGGLVDDIYSPHGECEFPYEGNLCDACANNFAKFGSSSRCINCESDGWYYVKFIGFFGIQIAAVLYGIKVNVSKIEKTKKARHNKELQDYLENENFQSNLMKITINFLQVSSIVTQFEFEWPEFITNFVNITNKTVPSDKDGFSIDCVIAMITGDNHNIYFIKLVINLIQPFALWMLLVLGYALFLKIKKQSLKGNANFKKNSVVLFIITAFILQPNIIQNTLEIFQCENYSTSESPVYYMMGDSETKCWTAFHILWSLGVAFPNFVLWAAAMPILLLLKLRKNAKHLDDSEIYAKYSFMYEGLKNKNYYWEFVTIARKTIIIIAFVFLNFFSVQSQAFATFLIILIFTVLHYIHWPYSDERLNRAELLGLITLNVMVYSGMFFLSEGGRDWLNIILIVISSGFNLAFYGYLAIQLLRSLKKTAKRLKSKANEMKSKVKQKLQERRSKNNQSGSGSGSGKGSGSNNSSISESKRENSQAEVKDLSLVLNKIQLDAPGTPGLFTPDASGLRINPNEFGFSNDGKDLEDVKDQHTIPSDDGTAPKCKVVFNEEKNDVDNYSVMNSTYRRNSAGKSFRSTLITPEMLNDMLNIYNFQKSSITNEFNSNDLPYLARTFSAIDKKVSPGADDEFSVKDDKKSRKSQTIEKSRENDEI